MRVTPEVPLVQAFAIVIVWRLTLRRCQVFVQEVVQGGLFSDGNALQTSGQLVCRLGNLLFTVITRRRRQTLVSYRKDRRKKYSIIKQNTTIAVSNYY